MSDELEMKKGARTTSRVRRDILWAYSNLDNPDAKPPSPGAKMWAEHAREQRGHFLACVVRLDSSGPDVDGDAGAVHDALTDQPQQRPGIDYAATSAAKRENS